MSRIAAIGERRRLEGFALAGIEVLAADGPGEVRSAWSHLDPDVAAVILTAGARDALSDLLPLRPAVIWTTLPD